MKQTLAFLTSLLFPSLAILHAADDQPRKPPVRPNIIFIMADDLGWTDTATYGSKYYETPNIDRLAAQGMKFLSHHHCQNCTPTRAALMSGQYGARTGLYTVGGIGRFDWSSRPLRPVDNVTELPLDRDIIAKQLKVGGYATGMFGKWDIGETKNLATDMPDKAKELHTRLVAWRKEVNAPMPTKNDGKASEKPQKKRKGKRKKNAQ